MNASSPSPSRGDPTVATSPLAPIVSPPAPLDPVAQPFADAAARYGGVFYDNLATVAAAANLASVAAAAAANASYTQLPTSDDICHAVIRLVQLNRAGGKRPNPSRDDDDHHHHHSDDHRRHRDADSGEEDRRRRRDFPFDGADSSIRARHHLDSDALDRRRKIRRTSSRDSTVIVNTSMAAAANATTFLSLLSATAAGGVTSPSTECNKNFMFNDSAEADEAEAVAATPVAATSPPLSQSPSPDGTQNGAALWTGGPSSSTVVSNHPAAALFDNKNSRAPDAADLNHPQPAIFQRRLLAALSPQPQPPPPQPHSLRSVVDSLSPLRRNRRYSHNHHHHQSAHTTPIHANGTAPLTANGTAERRPESHSEHSTPFRHKHSPRGPSLQQLGRNLIEFARASTPRIQRRIQSSKLREESNNSGGGSSTHSPQHSALPLAIGHNSTATAANAATPHRRSPFHPSSNGATPQRGAAGAPAPPPTDPERISASHPDFHVGAFLDEGMRPSKLDVLLQMDEPSREEMEKNAWNPEDRSLNIYVKEEDRLTLHRHPVAQSTDCIRGRTGYSRGFHVWQIVWPARQRGTHAVIGVATKQADLHAPGYSSLVGSNTESYGWDLIRNVCVHDSKHMSPWNYPDPAAVGERFSAPERVYCILDMDEGYMAFATDRTYLGVAFRNLRGQCLYPIVCAVWGHCEITIRYLGSLAPEPRGLMDICRRTIRIQMGPRRIGRVDELMLPQSLKDYLLFRQFCRL